CDCVVVDDAAAVHIDTRQQGNDVTEWHFCNDELGASNWTAVIAVMIPILQRDLVRLNSQVMINHRKFSELLSFCLVGLVKQRIQITEDLTDDLQLADKAFMPVGPDHVVWANGCLEPMENKRVAV